MQPSTDSSIQSLSQILFIKYARLFMGGQWLTRIGTAAVRKSMPTRWNQALMAASTSWASKIWVRYD